MMPLLLLLRDNDNDQKLAPGAGLGNVYMSFLRLQTYYKGLIDLLAPHKLRNFFTVDGNFATIPCTRRQ